MTLVIVSPQLPLLCFTYRNGLNKRTGAYLISLILRGRSFERGVYKIFLEKLGLKIQRSTLFFTFYIPQENKNQKGKYPINDVTLQNINILVTFMVFIDD